MRLESYLSIEHVDDPQNQSLTLTLINIRSINKHLIDLAYDERLRKSDLICLTEMQMMQRSQTEINSELQKFEIIHNTNEDRFQSLAFCLKDHIGLITLEKMVRASYITFSKTTYFDHHIKLLLLYKKHALNETLFYNWLAEFVNSHNIDIILVDFNINYFEGNTRLLHILSIYVQIASNSTHLSGSLLDHVYILKEFLGETDVTGSIADVYFSDHDAVKFIFTDRNK